ncbi:unnamed protein product [Sphenostylis stenocarpa]|uniref:Uncharacterized protein n=1 Tax=Sphenostylis stenocarpa TaxID=92480 RepID=A0AA86T9Z8_9FABA|nr:unnamed protein product [Sphenostylis stenocarpa]
MEYSQPSRKVTESTTCGVKFVIVEGMPKVTSAKDDDGFATLTYVDTSTYQIMGNLKIVMTGVLFEMFLGRRLSNLRWMAIVLLGRRDNH